MTTVQIRGVMEVDGEIIWCDEPSFRPMYYAVYVGAPVTTPGSLTSQIWGMH